MDSDPDWKEKASRIYRTGSLQVEKLKGSGKGDAEYWINDLRESMLGLKEAVIADDELWGIRQLIVLELLIAELLLNEQDGD